MNPGGFGGGVGYGGGVHVGGGGGGGRQLYVTNVCSIDSPRFMGPRCLTNC